MLLVFILILLLNAVVLVGILIYLLTIRQPKRLMSHQEVEDNLIRCHPKNRKTKRARYRMHQGTLYLPGDLSPPDSENEILEQRCEDDSFHLV